MSDSNETTQTSQPVRSTRAVLGLLGALLGIIVLIVAVVLVTTVDFSGGGGEGASLAGGVNENRFQAVYLNDGEIFFGSLRDGEGDWVVLRDAYFLRTTAGAASNDDKAPATTDKDDLQLAPFSSQIGSSNDMRINAREIRVVVDLPASSTLGKQLEDAN